MRERGKHAHSGPRVRPHIAHPDGVNAEWQPITTDLKMKDGLRLAEPA